jgi:hypothetical protein
MFVLPRALFLFTVCGLFLQQEIASQDSPASVVLSADQLARMIIANESSSQASDQTYWMFKLEKEESGKKEVAQVVETSAGDLSRLISVNDRPLTAEEQVEEEHRLEDLIRNPRKLRQLQKEKAEDSNRAQRLLKIVPDAFRFRYGERRGDLVQLKFVPNPEFRPPSREARVFHAMQGEMWLEAKHNRLQEISGRLIHDVKFGGGFLGHLDRGGQFYVRQAEVEPGYWELTAMTVNMKGKVLFFKTIGVQQRERRTVFHRVADDLTPAQAVRILRGQEGEKESRPKMSKSRRTASVHRLDKKDRLSESTL